MLVVRRFSAAVRRGRRPADLNTALKDFIQVFAAVEANAADPVNPAQASMKAPFPACSEQLDPFSVFFDPGQFEQLKELEKVDAQRASGVWFRSCRAALSCCRRCPGTPSAKSGISPGDEILAINGIPLARLDTEQLVQLLSQSRNQQVRLDVRRAGNARLLPLILTPEEVIRRVSSARS